ncbi:MAG: signal transduction histidine kinase/DNA-binding response OmpR family regulator [Glaciecola sp.]|jgi:signal transduction histidine kinase/DNA-binding response OmpR family regulator
MRILCLTLLLIISLQNHVTQANEYAEIGQPITDVFTLKEHGGNEQNWSLTQAENGFIYVGHSEGISEWDGESWHNYATPHNTPVRRIIQWKDERLYIGTTNDIGYYQTNKNGVLSYYSLLDGWTEEQRQFGQVWGAAANKYGVIFVTIKAVMFWNGEKVRILNNVKPGRYRIFSVNNIFIFKHQHDPYVSEVNFDSAISTIQSAAIPTTAILGDSTSSAETPNTVQVTVKKSSLQLPVNAIPLEMFTNQNENLVVLTRSNGIYEQTGDVTNNRVPASNASIATNLYNAIQASDGYYYVSSLHDGLFILNESMQLLRQYRENDSISMDTIFGLMEDRQGNIWLSGVPNIVKMVPPHRYSRFQVGNTSTTVTRLTRRSCNTGECTVVAGNGLFQLKPSLEPFISPVFERLISSKYNNSDYIEYHNHQIYSGYLGIYYRKIGEEDEPFQKLLSVRHGQSLRIDPITGTLFASSVEGIYRITYENNKWEHKQFIDNHSNEIIAMEIDDAGVIWVGTALQTLYRIENAQFEDKETKITLFGENEGLAPGKITPIKLSVASMNDNLSGIAIATKNGLMTYQQQHHHQPSLRMLSTFPELFHSNNVPVNFIFDEQSVAQDLQRIWYQIGDSAGYITQDDNLQWQQHETLFNAFDEKQLIDLFVAQKNILWFALSTGEVYRVNIALTESVPAKGKLNIRNISNLQNNNVINGGLLTSTFPELDQQTNSIRINYALADNSSLVNTQYRHRLLGSSKEQWSAWTQEHYNDFTQLGGSNYQFQLEAKDPWGRIAKKEFAFTILPPWYLSTIAWIIYSVIAIGLLILSSWLTQRWRTRKLKLQNIELENTVTERTREVSAKVNELKEQQKLKDRFFSNVSHEFRTPLTLVIGPLETLLSGGSDTMNRNSLATTALNNANKMLALVGQVLDLNRLEVGKLPLRVSQYDIAELMRNMQKRFESWAQQENQMISCQHCDEPILLYFDQDQIDKCIANLLSNAIKYSGNNSQITINIVAADETVTLQIIDNGRGISEQSKNKVFERFYQGESSERNTTPGTGIGLSLVKEIVELHHGEVGLTTSLNQGCCFSLTLKKDKDHFAEEQLVEPIALAKIQLVPINEILQTNGENQQDKTTLLIIDDNAELRHFISLRLSASYRILQAENGEQGFTLAQDELPDLIVSDVMMPKMTGYELTKKLKSTPATRTIPVILLTAKASKRETVEGFACGADDYLTKPFDTSELIMRVNAQINIRKTIRDRIQFEHSVGAVKTSSKTPFAVNMQIEVVNHLSEPEFTVEDLANLLFMSRSTLTRKCKDKLDMSPRAYIIQIRMQHACELLQADTLSVSEIAYAVGFESLAYFSRSFKKQHGKPPSEYIAH